jgi:hypothetical protein
VVTNCSQAQNQDMSDTGGGGGEDDSHTPLNKFFTLTHSGMLYKMGDSLHQWSSKYFVLDGPTLTYFSEKSDSKPKRVIRLKHFQLYESEEKFSGKFALFLKSTSLAQEYTLAADDAESIKLWTKKLKLAILTDEKQLILGKKKPAPVVVKVDLKESKEEKELQLDNEEEDSTPEVVGKDFVFARDSQMGQIVREAEDSAWILFKVDEFGIAHWMKKSSEEIKNLGYGSGTGLLQLEKFVGASFVCYFILHKIWGPIGTALLLCGGLIALNLLPQKIARLPKVCLML